MYWSFVYASKYFFLINHHCRTPRIRQKLLKFLQNAMNPYRFMHQYHILDGLERFSKTIPRNKNIYKADLKVSQNLQRTSTMAPGWSLQIFLHHPVHFYKYLHFVKWSWKICWDHPNWNCCRIEAFRDQRKFCPIRWVRLWHKWCSNSNSLVLSSPESRKSS